MKISLVPTNARVSRDAMVEIITFGTPTDRLRMTAVPRVVIANNSTSLSKFDEEINKVKITFTREGSGGAPSSV